MNGLLINGPGQPDNLHAGGVLVGATRAIAPSTREQRFTLDILDLDAGATLATRIPLDFFVHGIAFHPGRPREAAAFEKRGTGGCALDLEAPRLGRPIPPMMGHAFYGHAAYSHDGDVLFVVESRLGSDHGAISIRDSRTFAVQGVFPTFGTAPHDCHLIEQGRTLVITNGGGPVGSASLPSVTFIDVNSCALLEKHEVFDGNRNAGHVAVAENREFAAVSAPREGLPARTSLGGVSLRRRGKPWVHMATPEAVTSRMIGESLSVVIHSPTGTVAATHPDGDMITFWSLEHSGFVGSLELPGPRGVTLTLDKRFFVVSYGDEARLLFIEPHSFRVLPDPGLGEGIFGGAHLYAWKS